MSDNVVSLPPKPKSIRKYKLQMKFDNGAQAAVTIEAGDHVGVAAKIAGLFSDQPRAVKQWQVIELEEDRRILPATAMPKILPPR